MAFWRTGSTFRRLTALAAACTAAFVASLAQAQTVTVQPQSLERKLGFRPSDQEPTWINYSDCTNQDELSFETILSGAVGYSLEVWVGASADCTPYEARLGNAPTCWQVYKTSPQATTQLVTIQAQDIIAQNKSSDASWGPNSGTSADCDEAGGPTEGQTITLHFMLVDGTGQPVGTGSLYETKYDLVGPPAPTGVSAGVGEDMLVVKWSASTASDLTGYRIYCDPKPGAAAPANAPMAGGAAGTSGAAGAGGAAGSTSGGAAGSTTGGAAGGGSGGTTATGGAAGSAGSGGSGGNPDCPSSALVVGERPDSAYQCGSVTGSLATSAKASDLVNGVTYAVAVAGVDRVGNSGELSAVACGSPQPVDDFFELYRRSGGKGGGGFCSLGREPSSGAAWLLFAALGALAARRGRRLR